MKINRFDQLYWAGWLTDEMVSKYLVIVLNVLMLLIGTVVLTLGLWGMNVGSQVSHIVSLTTPTLIMLLGVTTILVSLFGIYAAAEEDPLLLQLVDCAISFNDLTFLVPWTHDTDPRGPSCAVEHGPCSPG